MKWTGWCAVAGLVGLLVPGCGAQESAGTPTTTDAGGDAKVVADQSSGPDLGKKLAGPCSTTLVIGGKAVADYIRTKYDSKGRKVDEHTWADASKHTYTHTWAWDTKGQLAAEKFDTTGAAPNVDFKFVYDSKGRLSKKTGSMTGYKTVDCMYEYNAAGGKLSFEQCTRGWDILDEDDNVIDAKEDKYTVSYSHGVDLITEEHMLLNDSSPDKTVWKYLDAKGRLIKLEIDYSTRGYAEERTTYTWDDGDHLLTEAFDTDADDTVETTSTHSYDSYGNWLGSKFSYSAGVPALTTDLLALKATSHELVGVYACSDK